MEWYLVALPIWMNSCIYEFKCANKYLMTGKRANNSNWNDQYEEAPEGTMKEAQHGYPERMYEEHLPEINREAVLR